jgi:hypothetical protein
LRHAAGMPSRKGTRDSLTPVEACRWLVVRDRYSVVLECLELRPSTDLRAVMLAERERRIREGWTAGEVPRNCGFFFCERGTERLCVAIECFQPAAHRPVRRSSVRHSSAD